jgi:hypothetical protein
MTQGDYGRSQPERTTEHGRLEALIGTWHTSGQMEPTDAGPGGEVDATDTYEWLPGGFGLLHTVDALVGGEKVVGAEIIGWDPSHGTYFTHYIGSDGPSDYEAQLAEKEGALTWRMVNDSSRFTGTFDADRTFISGRWELKAEAGDWLPWMKITLAKTGDWPEQT